MATPACQTKPAEEPILGPYVESLEPEPMVQDRSHGRDEIREVFQRHMPEIHDCYERTNEAKAPSEGKVVVRVEIDKEGAVVGVGVKSSTLKPANKALERCIGESVAKYEFPKSRFDRDVDFPYTFSALQRK